MPRSVKAGTDLVGILDALERGKGLCGTGSAGTGSIAFKSDWMTKPGRPMSRRASKLQSVARPKKFIAVK